MATAQVELPQRQVYVNMRNNTLTEMRCERYIGFNGAPTPGPLPSIPAGDIIFLNNVVTKGAVIYAGQNRGQLPTAWVMAWDAPTKPSPRKVYVACGAKIVIDKMTPEEIERNLDQSTDFSVAVDPITGVNANASVVGAVPGDSANVSANFGLV